MTTRNTRHALAAFATLALLTTPFAHTGHGAVGAYLITKTETNPFFVKMKEGTQKYTTELGLTLNSYTGRIDGDNESQVKAIETCIANGAKGILLTPSNTKAIVPVVKRARAALGTEAANARIAMLDLDVSQPPVSVLRDQGFLKGFCIDLADLNKWGDEKDSRIVDHDVTQGNEEGGRRAMENLLAEDPGNQRRLHHQRAGHRWRV